MNLILPSDPHLRRWMLFVDGENFTIRAQKVVASEHIKLAEGPYFSPDVFIWLPDVTATRTSTNAGR